MTSKEANLKQGKNTKKKGRSKRLIVSFILVALLSFVGGGFLIYSADYYHDLDTAHVNLISTEQMPVSQGPNYLAFGNPEAETAFVFYPGAKVEYSAYAPLLREIAAEGNLCFVVRMPFNLAIFDSSAAQAIMEQYPQVSHWWIGGHSLGGAMAASYASSHPEQLDGLILLGAYSDSDLSQTQLSVLCLYGSSDEILNRSKLEESRTKMPPTYTETVIEGGNHAYFGNYGEQAGDGKAVISPESQWLQTARLVSGLMNSPSVEPPSA